MEEGFQEEREVEVLPPLPASASQQPPCCLLLLWEQCSLKHFNQSISLFSPCAAADASTVAKDVRDVVTSATADCTLALTAVATALETTAECGVATTRSAVDMLCAAAEAPKARGRLGRE